MISLTHAEFDSEQLLRATNDILESVVLCSVATSNSDCTPHIHTCYFCYTKNLELFFVSDPNTTHGRNVARNPRTSIAIFSTEQHWGKPIKGLQLFGSTQELALAHSAVALATHAARFRAYAEYIKALNPTELSRSPYRFYRFMPERIKIVDEPTFGEETFVVAEVHERT